IQHFSAVDLFTRFSLAEVHTRATANLAASFLARLMVRAPFPIPTPNEPPRSPKLNGHVERMQRTFRDEFYTRPLPSQIPELQRG
ncbi:IS481 family transposase, partial [Thermus scotoductus]